jgi:hypothetical protein
VGSAAAFSGGSFTAAAGHFQAGAANHAGRRFHSQLALRVERPLLFTFWQAGLSTLLTFVVGVPAAYVFCPLRFSGRKTRAACADHPAFHFCQPLVAAAGFNALLGPRGWLNLGLMFLFNLRRAAGAGFEYPGRHPHCACVLQHIGLSSAWWRSPGRSLTSVWKDAARVLGRLAVAGVARGDPAAAGAFHSGGNAAGVFV